jgi:osmotically-inducible protein OsmY
MNKRVITLFCALAAAACSNSPDGNSARSPAASAGGKSDTRASVASTAEPVAAKEGTGVGSTGTEAEKEAMRPSPAGASPTVIDDPGVADQTKNADNTKINERDRHGTLTPMDQGNSADERRITASIRKEIMGDKTVSFTGKNVKVITVGSKVTLRGPVKSDQGKSEIGAIASRTAGVSEVDNQLEVKK